MLTRTSAIITILLFIFLTTPSFSQTQTLHPLNPSTPQQFNNFLSPPITVFTPKQFNAHHQIFCLADDYNGNMWFGTLSELLLYDGSGFEHIEVGAGKYVLSIDIDSTGKVFIGCQGDFGYIVHDGFHNRKFISLQHLIPDSLKDFNIIWNTHILKNKVVFNGFKYLFIYDMESNTIQTLLPQKKFFRSHKIDEQLWIQDSGIGLFALDLNPSPSHRGEGSKTVEQYKLQIIQGSEFFKDMDVISILPYINGYLVITDKDGLFIFHPNFSKNPKSQIPNPKLTTPFAAGIKELLSKSNVYCATLLDSTANPIGASVAIGTRLDGIFFLAQNGSLLLHLNQQTGLPSNIIWNLSSDRQNNLWATTDNGIALLHTGLGWTLTPEGKEFQGSVQSITQFHPSGDHPQGGNEKIWLATSQGVYYQNGTHIPGLPAGALSQTGWYPLSSIKGQCFAMIANKELLLVAASNAGLQKIQKEIQYGRDHTESSRYISSQISKHYAYSLSFVENLSVYVVFGGRDGLGVIDLGARNKDVELEMNKTPEEIKSIKAYYHNDTITIWAGMQTRGVCRLAIPVSNFKSEASNLKPEITHFDTTHGLPQGKIQIFTLHHSPVFGTDKGLYKYECLPQPLLKEGENGRFIPDCSLDTIFCNGSRQVYRLAEEDNGEVWINDGKGGQIKHLMLRDGKYVIDSVAFMGMAIGSIRAIYPNSNVCWLGGDNGVVCYNKKTKWSHKINYPALIRKVSVKTGGQKDSVLFGGALYAGEKALAPVLAYGYNNLTFHYSAPFYDRMEEIEYSYVLNGQDTAWSPWSKENSKEYTNLYEASYVFKVKAKNIYGTESEVGEYGFKVLPPFHRTLLFYMLQGGGVLLLFGIAMIFSRFLNYGWAGAAGAAIGTVAIFIIFEYSQNLVEAKFADVLGEVILYKVLLNVLCALALFPMETLINRMLGIKIVRMWRGDKARTLYDKARTLGKVEGLQEGEKKGLKKGLEKGQEKKKNEVIKKMREKGYKDDEIKSVT